MSGTIEEFDDDTDFALPAVPAQSGSGGIPAGAGPEGMSMEAMQQMMAQMQGGGGGAAGNAGGSASMPSQGMMNLLSGGDGGNAPAAVELSAEEKRWVTVYPIYFDAKRRFEKGCRRVAYKQACLWPKSEQIEKAIARLTLMHAHEGRKTHPRDWENPGRVKVQLFSEEGKPLNQKIKTKKDLLCAIAEIIQPECGGVPPPLPAHPKRTADKASKEKGNESIEKKATNGKAAQAQTTKQPNKNAKARAEKPKHRLPIRIDGRDRVQAAHKIGATSQSLLQAPKGGKLPAYSPSREAGILNADFGGMMGGLQGMGPLGAMMGSMGLGDDDDDDDAAQAEAEQEEDKKKKDPMQQLSRRQRKRVIRVGR